MGVQSRLVEVGSEVHRILESCTRSRSMPQHVVERARIVLMSAAGVANQEQASRLEVDVQRIWRWRNRWSDKACELQRIQQAGLKGGELEYFILDLLSDNHRSGTRPKFSAEQVAQLIALACEPPEESGLPVSHWTSAELAQEAQRRGIVEEISPRLVAERCSLVEDLGKKGHSGVLKCMESRAQFLSDPHHRIRFVFTPKHCSWLNQIEIWFGMLARRLLRRSSFKSCDNLRQRVLDFIAYFNRVLARPFKWTYAGKLLTA